MGKEMERELTESEKELAKKIDNAGNENTTSEEWHLMRMRNGPFCYDETQI